MKGSKIERWNVENFSDEYIPTRNSTICIHIKVMFKLSFVVLAFSAFRYFIRPSHADVDVVEQFTNTKNFILLCVQHCLSLISLPLTRLPAIFTHFLFHLFPFFNHMHLWRTLYFTFIETFSF